MDLRQMKYFQMVAEELSFSKASRRLNIAQPALSRAVSDLETELAIALFDRNRRQVRLTPAGSVLLEESRLLTDRISETLRRVHRTAAGQEGELRLGYIGPPTRDFLGGLLKEYHRQFPLVSIVLEERTPERVWEMVSKGRLSVGITRPVMAHERLGLQQLQLREEVFCAAVPLDHPWAERPHLPWKALADQPIILLARREGVGSHDAIQAACLDAGFTPRVVHTPSVIGTTFQYVEAGVGIGIVPEGAMTKADAFATKLIPLRPKRTIPLIMVWSRDGDEPAVAAFRRLVTKWLVAATAG
jgi:DNA-binding transcriptional LysR family regulator